MFNVFEKWKQEWDRATFKPADELTPEKETGEIIPYPYPVKKVRLDDRIEIAYVDEGDPGAETLLFIHGMASAVPVWRKNIKDLKGHYRCIALDLPGHGYSSKGNYPYTMNFYADVILSFVKVLGLPPVILAGHSMGAQIACVAALKEPGLVKRLILASPSGFEPYSAMDKQGLINLTAATMSMGQAFTQHKLNFLMGFCNHKEEAGELSARIPIYKQDAAQFGMMMLKCTESMLLEALVDVLGSIRQPCLIVVGSDDMVSPYQYIHGEKYEVSVRKQALRIPHYKVVRFSPCGHFVQYQKPRLFNKEVMAFLSAGQVTDKIKL
jgi:pimeloyl-ACP methyl ester carboxylesterase